MDDHLSVDDTRVDSTLSEPETWPVPAITLQNVNPATQELFHALRIATGLHRGVLAVKLAEHGSHPAEALCLRLIAHQDGISQRELSMMMQRSRSWISMIMGSLEGEGMVVRRTDETDRRVTRAHLTSSGREREAELDRVLSDYLNGTMSLIPEEDQLHFIRLLNQLTRHITTYVIDDSAPPV
jgi:DNA-binding MarR family transcriptional regulator